MRAADGPLMTQQPTQIDLDTLARVTGGERQVSIGERAYDSAAWAFHQLQSAHRAFWRWYTAPTYL